MKYQPRFIIHSDNTIEQIIEPCEDAVSREYILSKAHCCCDDLADDEPCCVDVDDIKNAPSVWPIRPKGEWDILGCDLYICSKYYSKYTHKFNFCPTCGADMRGVQK